MTAPQFDILDYQSKGLNLDKWQNLVNMLAELFEAASGDIIQYKGDHFSVVTTSTNQENFLSVHSSWSWNTKTFCKYIVENRCNIYVNDAHSDPDWFDAPFVVNGQVCSYLGEPIYWPNGTIFGSFCVIDNKPTHYSEKLRSVISQLKLLIESELQHLVDLNNLEKAISAKNHNKNLVEQEYKKRVETEVKLATKESIVATTLETLVDAVIRIDPNGTILAINSATLIMFQYEEDELLNQNVEMLMPDDEADKHTKQLRKYLDRGTKKVIGKGQLIRAKRKNGQLFPVRISVSKLSINGQKQFIGLVEDITEKFEYEQKLKNQALHDTLTGCANRLLLEQRLLYHIEDANRAQSKFTIAYIDLNKFKLVNDTYGHKAGDLILIETSKRIKQQIRSADLLSRVGGDEFVIVFNKEINQNTITIMLNELIKQPISFNNEQLNVSACIGYATFPDDGKTMDALMDKADKMMYRCKNN